MTMITPEVDADSSTHVIARNEINETAERQKQCCRLEKVLEKFRNIR